MRRAREAVSPAERSHVRARARPLPARAPAGRVLHPCPAGCCGPTPCYSRAVSLVKAKNMIDVVVMRRLVTPAMNKWTKLDPAFCQSTIKVCFFQMITVALERKTRTTYASVTASGQDAAAESGEEDAEGDSAKKGQMMRYGRRSLAFVGKTDSRWLLLIWVAIGQHIMNVHYRLFKGVTWLSHFVGDRKRTSIFDFCPDVPKERNPALKALADLSAMLLCPNTAGKELIGPLYGYYGATVHWPSGVLQMFQKSTLAAYCKLYRSLFRVFKRHPWKLMQMLTATAAEKKREAAKSFWDAADCCRDDWVGKPLRAEICATWEDLLRPELLEFLIAFYGRCVPTSTFVERLFAPLTQWTSEPRAKHRRP